MKTGSSSVHPPFACCWKEPHLSELLDMAIVSEFDGEEIDVLELDPALYRPQLLYLDTLNECAYGAR